MTAMVPSASVAAPWMPRVPSTPSDLASDPPADAAARPSPVMEQYLEIKAANPDSLLFYRMGDFYELFFEDAEVAARALGIVLTKRGKHLGRDIPMCGVPVVRSDEYLHRLIAQGHRVAVCEQMEDPAAARKRGSKSIVKRDVVRLVTPGTLTEDTLLDARRNNYLLALARARAVVERRHQPVRAGLDRHLHGRISYCRMRPRRPCGRAGAAGAKRDRRLRRALFRHRPRAVPAHPAGGDAADARRVRRRHRRAAAVVVFFRGDLELVRRAVAPGADRRRRLHHLCGAHAARPAPAAVAAGARGGRRDARDRPGHPRQSRADPHAWRRTARARCSPPSTAPSPPPARGCSPSASPRR